MALVAGGSANLATKSGEEVMARRIRNSGEWKRSYYSPSSLNSKHELSRNWGQLAMPHEEADDMNPNEEDERRAMKLNSITTASLRCERFEASPCLVALLPNEAGWYTSFRYRGGPFDSTKYSIEQEGWDHDHCLWCNTRITPGVFWWCALSPNEFGLCNACYGSSEKFCNTTPEEQPTQ